MDQVMNHHYKIFRQQIHKLLYLISDSEVYSRSFVPSNILQSSCTAMNIRINVTLNSVSSHVLHKPARTCLNVNKHNLLIQKVHPKSIVSAVFQSKSSQNVKQTTTTSPYLFRKQFLAQGVQGDKLAC